MFHGSLPFNGVTVMTLFTTLHPPASLGVLHDKLTDWSVTLVLMRSVGALGIAIEIKILQTN